MLTPPAIQSAACRALQVIDKPARVILFGSYARGDAGENSDLDLMVVKSEITDPTAEYRRIRDAIGCMGVGVDLLLYTEAEFQARKDWWVTPVYWAAREGKVIGESIA